MTWVQTYGNRKMDLLAPTMTALQLLDEVPEALAKEARFSGNNQGAPYSVAQHCVMGGDHLLYASPAGKLAAAAFLLHDGHEFAIGDYTTPACEAISVRIGRIAGPAAEAAHRQAVREQKSDLDAAIYRAAGLPWPLDAQLAAEIKETDIRMLATERRWMLGPSPAPWPPAVENARPIRFTGKFSIWSWDRAADEYRQRLRRWLPVLALAWLDRSA